MGAGTGRYSIQLSEEGYDVTAIELVKYNLGILKSKGSNVKAYQGTALNLSRFADESFDITLVFGPMYHLYTLEDKLKALSEAKRVTKKGGYLLIAYYMNEYGVLTHGFIDGQIKESLAGGKLTEDFHCIAEPEDLYERVRTEDIQELNERLGLNRVKLIATDGAAHYIRQTLNSMDEETFQLFLKYHLSTCERQDLIDSVTYLPHRINIKTGEYEDLKECDLVIVSLYPQASIDYIIENAKKDFGKKKEVQILFVIKILLKHYQHLMLC